MTNQSKTRRGVQRAAIELSVLLMARDIEDVVRTHTTVASHRRAIAKRPWGGASGADRQRRQRTEQELEILSFARVLESLRQLFPSFDERIKQLQYYARKQLTRPSARRAELLKLIEDAGGRLSQSDLLESTLYDKPIVRADIRTLMRQRKVKETKTTSLPGPRGGRPTVQIFYGLAGPSAKFSQTQVTRNCNGGLPAENFATSINKQK
jgi:hypothetical protein